MEISALEFLQSTKKCAVKILRLEVEGKIAIKFRITLTGLFGHQTTESELNMADSVKSFTVAFRPLLLSDNIEEKFDEIVNELVERTLDFDEGISGWMLLSYIFIDIECIKFDPLRANGYFELPAKLAAKKAVINVMNENNKCFVYAVLASKYHEKFSTRLNLPETYDRKFKDLNLNGIDFPMKVNDISKFERQNPEYSVNVYFLDYDRESSVTGPLYVTKEVKRFHSDLLFMDNGVRTHYACITSLSRLVGASQLNSRCTTFFCKLCLSNFSSEFKFLEHETIGCEQIKVEMPSEGENEIVFKNFAAKQRHPFVISADIECLLIDVQNTDDEDECGGTTNSDLNENVSYTRIKQRHVPFSYAYNISSDIITDDDFLNGIRLFQGERCMKHFVASLIRDVNYLTDRYLNNILPKEVNPQRESEVACEKICSICGDEFKSFEPWVVDHCHLTMKIRGKAHNKCNLAYRTPRFVPVFFHNGSKYDTHLVIMELAKTKLPLKCIPENKETYISFSVNLPKRRNHEKKSEVEIRFLDSFRFMPSSLSSLAKSLGRCESLEEFQRNEFPSVDLKDRKQPCPYEVFNSFEVLRSNVFPAKDAFFNKLTNEPISDEDYDHALNVFNHLEDKTLGGYSNLYLKCDVLLLSDCLKNFRNSIYNHLSLDPVFFYTSAALSFNSMLLHLEGRKINLISDQSMVKLLRDNIRGGISCSMLRFSEANNKYLPNYDPSKESVFNMYYDINGLYGFIMSDCPLPHSDFKFIEDRERQDEILQSIMNHPADDPKGYILQCDFDYSSDLHDSQNELPYLVEHKKIGRCVKLVPNLNNKRNYLCHYRNFQQAIKVGGLKLIKVHRIIEFSQSRWLRPYIKMCQELRKASSDEFNKYLWKLLQNIIFGKMIQGMDDRNVKLITSWMLDGLGCPNDARKLVSNPRFKSYSIFSEDFVAIEMRKTSLKYNRPTIVGFSILELSKFHMYEYYYSFFKKELGSSCIAAYIDTDSYILQVKGHDIYDFMKLHADRFDTSNYPNENVFNIIPANKKVPGILKDEGAGVPLNRFICLKAKCYIVEFMHADGTTSLIKKAKSVSMSASKYFEFVHYHDVWRKKNEMYAKMYQIRSKNHIISTILMNKKSLSQDDDKRYILSDNIHTLAWGHFKIPPTSENS